MGGRGKYAAAWTGIVAALLSLTGLCSYAAQGHCVPQRPTGAVAPEPRDVSVADPRGVWEFRYVHDSTHFRLYATVPEVPLAYLGGVAEDSLAVACELLQLDPVAIRVRDLPVYVCRHIDHMFDVEFRHEIPWAGKYDRRGSFYRCVPMIAFVDEPEANPEIVAHEVAHWVASQISTRLPRVINEGLAEWDEEVVLHRRAECHELATSVAARRAGILDPSGSLERLFRCGRPEFLHSEYAQARCLAKVLVDLEACDQPRLRRLLEEYQRAPRGSDPWLVFADVYPAADVQRVWRVEMEIARRAHWFGPRAATSG